MEVRAVGLLVSLHRGRAGDTSGSIEIILQGGNLSFLLIDRSSFGNFDEMGHHRRSCPPSAAADAVKRGLGRNDHSLHFRGERQD